MRSLFHSMVRRVDLTECIEGKEFVDIFLEKDVLGVWYLAGCLHTTLNQEVIALDGVKQPLHCIIIIGILSAFHGAQYLEGALR